jgi:hypothetical protein
MIEFQGWGDKQRETLFAIDRLREKNEKKRVFWSVFVACLVARPSSTLQQMITPINISFAEILMRLRLRRQKKEASQVQEERPREEFICRSAANL